MKEKKNSILEFAGIFTTLIISTLMISCSTVPVTGRSQLNIVPENQMISMSLSQYDQFLQENKLSKDFQKTRMVKVVGQKIQGAVERYFSSMGMADQIKSYKWEFNLVEGKEANAWCMPGGKVVVYTGILPVTQNEAGLAVVMGHEIAHAVARHGNERMSQSMIAKYGGIALTELLKQKPAATRNLYMQAFGIGTQYGLLLPYSRLQESEADKLGLIFMAMAGYDPGQAVGFWQRMSQNSKGNKPPEFMSTHPSDATRISKIKKFLPEASKHYRK